MAKEWAAPFYNSPLWKAQREAYRRHAHGICEMCGAPGEIVHHVVELTPDNIGDPEISLSFDNLQLLCRDCHAAVTFRNDAGTGLYFDERGELRRRGVPPGADSGRRG